MVKNRLALYASAIIVVAGLAREQACAQSAGTYGGQQANGLPISILVGRYKGQLVVEAFSAQTQTTCRDGASLVIDSGYGQVGPITNGSGQGALNFGSYYGSLSYTFDDATHSVSGFVRQIYSTFVPPNAGAAAPVKSTYCTSGNQAFAAVLDRTANFDPKVKAVQYQRPDDH